MSDRGEESGGNAGNGRFLHLELGRLAVSRGWLDVDRLGSALTELPDCPQNDVPRIWEEHGLLSEAQATELLDEVLWARPRTGRVASLDRGALDELMASAPRESVASDEHLETIGHDATLIRQRAVAKPTEQPPAQPISGAPVPTRPTGPMPALDPATSSIAQTMGPPTQVYRAESGPTSSGEGMWTSGDEPALRDALDVATLERAFAVRYELREAIGQGGSGVVLRAFDRAMGRTVAMKVLRDRGGPERTHRLLRFIDEARGTGRLEHPHIIPIYDVGLLPDGQAYYTMKLLRRNSLRGVVRQLAEQNETTRREYRLGRLLQIFQQVCQAIAYAHDRGVIHRDLKPDNIMLGDYGEVLVTDWGLARALARPAESFESPDGEVVTLGTPAYMPPEQALGSLELVDELSDVYSLGAILYEMLTLHPPYDGPSALTVLEQVVEGRLVAPSQRAAGRHIPSTLEDICMRAMSPDRDRRYANALALHDDVQAFIEGQQSREASRKVYLGRMSSREYFRCIDDRDALGGEVRALGDEIAAWAPIEEKQALWTAQDGLERVWGQIARSYSDAVRAFTQALAYNPNDDDARRGLADIYWSRFQQAEARKNVVDQVHYEALIRQMDREDRYAALLEGHGTLSLTTSVPASVTIYAFRERDRRLEPWDPNELGTTPIEGASLPMGSYVADVTVEGRPPVRYPIYLDRCGQWRGAIDIPAETDVPEGFVLVPGGPYLSGGDPDARVHEPQVERDLGSFLLARDMVTFDSYLQFLDAVQARDPEEAARRAPQTRDGDGILAEIDLASERWVPREILIEGDARKRYPRGAGYEKQIPVMCIDVDDALAYVHWRSERDGRRYRLPTVYEMEKATRGVDGRFFPWGDHFDATFCKMRLSRPEMPQPEPVGVFEHDVSVYGARDMAGSLQAWVRDEAWLDNDVEPERDDTPLPGCEPGERIPESTVVIGGSWNHFEQSCRTASWMRMLSVGRSVSVGLRLALDHDGTSD